MALKSTSSPITISVDARQGVLNTFEVLPIDLQLNPLDQEVFVVTAVKVDMINHPLPLLGVADNIASATYELAVCKNRPAAMQTIGDNNCVAYTDVTASASFDSSNNPTSVAFYEQGSSDSPPSQLEYLDIIATDNFFIAMEGINTRATLVAGVRVYGYRARADAATYAALVQSEMLSQ